MAQQPRFVIGYWTGRPEGVDGLIHTLFLLASLLKRNIPAQLSIEWLEPKIQGGWLRFGDLRVKLEPGSHQADETIGLLQNLEGSELVELGRRCQVECAHLLTGAANDDRTVITETWRQITDTARSLRDGYVSSGQVDEGLSNTLAEQSSELVRLIQQKMPPAV